MEWARRYMRRKLLSYRLWMSDRRYDKLVDQSKRFGIHSESRSDTTVAKGNTELDFPNTSFDLEYVEIINELEMLESRALSNRLEKWLLDVSVCMAIKVIGAVQYVLRKVRKHRSHKKLQSKNPHPLAMTNPRILLPGVAGLVIFSYRSLFFLGFVLNDYFFRFR